MGTKLSGAGFAVKTVSHGLAGGTISHLRGGKFGHGFASAATLVGGTLSRISGGNFTQEMVGVPGFQ